MSDTALSPNLDPAIATDLGLPLDREIDRYETAIQTLEKAGTDTTIELILEVLCTRDRIAARLAREEATITPEAIVKVLDLDTQLKHLSPVVGGHTRLEHCRNLIQPPESAWWWFLTPPVVAPKRSKLTSQDWLWNGLTVACLVLSASFITNTLKAFSQGGLDLLQTFGAVGQGAGLLVFSGGAFTDRGKKIVEDVLTSINVPPAYQAEVTFAGSAAILAIAYGVNHSLPNLGNYYYEWGLYFYAEGKLQQAETNFKEALNFAPHDYRNSKALGNIYETLEKHDEAALMYQPGLIAGDPGSLNGMGRVLMRTADSQQDLWQAETNFHLALADPDVTPSLRSEVHSHLGLALLKASELEELTPEESAAKLDTAAEFLKEGNKIDRTIVEDREAGLGIGYCYLAEVFERQDKPEAASEQWELCVTNAIPTSLPQYRDILIFGGHKLHGRLDTSKILSDDES